MKQRSSRSHHWGQPIQVLLVAVLAVMSSLRAADLTKPENARLLAQWGYLNVIAYGADPTGRRDSTREVQKAIDDAAAQGKAVLLPLGTYVISDTLICYKKWIQTDPNKISGFPDFPFACHILIGEKRGGRRPLIKLAATAPKFDDDGQPRPMIAFANLLSPDRNFKAPANDAMIRAINAMRVPKDIVVDAKSLFDEILDGVNFDCSGHRGAVGIFFPAAQKSLLLDVDVLAEGAHTGIHGLPGRNSGAANLSVRGGRFGLVLSSNEAGVTVVGLRLHGQTERALVCPDFVPACIVGFDIKARQAPVITLGPAGDPTAKGTLALLDGSFQVEGGGPLLDNRAGKAVYLRNVHVAGSTPIIASGARPAIGGRGAWYRVAEYCYTDQTDPAGRPPYPPRESRFRQFSVINGQLSREPEPLAEIQHDVPAPADWVRRHLYAALPQISFSDSSKTINVMDPPYGAKPDGSDNWEKLQRAIDDGQRDGRVVYLPKGTFLISRTLELRSKTKLIGLGCKRNPREPLTVLAAHPSWGTSPDNTTLVRTADDAEAETFLGGMNLAIAADGHRYIHWRSGRNSTMMNLGFPRSGPTAETTILFSGNGGGRHYLLEPQSPAGTKEHRHVRIVGTSQPLLWYGCNLEAGAKVAANLEMTDASNIRIYGIKREGRSPTLMLNNCRNVAIFTQGAMREGVGEGSGGYIQIRGRSDGLLMPLILVQTAWGTPNGEPTLIEHLAGGTKVAVTWPESVSLYKRGEIDDGPLRLSR